MKKLSYKEAFLKRATQEYIFSRASFHNIIGLPGPDIQDYVMLLKEYGFERIELFENDFDVFIEQLCKLPKESNLTMGNILHYINKEWFNDLDFCCSITSIEKKLQKICLLKEYSLTVSVRPIGTENTISIYKKYAGEDIHFIQYRDSSPMITFYKLLKF